jgi:hypothetical protein
VNAEWPERGMPSTDLLKGLIARIVAHPDTFTGEIELVENGQWRQSWEYSLNNAERHSQTMQEVVDTFAGRGYHVGAYDWTAIGYGSGNRWVSEFDQSDTVSGYVREDSTGMTYAKFVTSYGTSISTRLGVWNGASYEPQRLKFINMPVLKCHQYMGVSASVKHYIGFLSYQAIGAVSLVELVHPTVAAAVADGGPVVSAHVIAPTGKGVDHLLHRLGMTLSVVQRVGPGLAPLAVLDQLDLAGEGIRVRQDPRDQAFDHIAVGLAALVPFGVHLE